ncbi:MAG: response regulator [Acetobacteraceae bacterium]
MNAPWSGSRAVRSHHQVQGCGTGEARGVDLVFSDIQMPGSMDGLELARRLRVERPSLPVILASGGTAGVTTFITKPYRM